MLASGQLEVEDGFLSSFCQLLLMQNRNGAEECGFSQAQTFYVIACVDSESK